MQYHPDLENLKSRFLTFTHKLMAKANELEQEALMSAQAVYDEDDDHYKRTYNQFKLGIEGQFKHLIEKTREVFDQQIYPIRESGRYENNRDWYLELSEVNNQFEKDIYAKIKYIFGQVKEISPEVHLQKVLEEYEEIKDAFHCHQCGANLVIDQIYFVSTYITCPYCQTQNTFVPGTRMKELQHLAREVAEERLKNVAKNCSELKTSGISTVEWQWCNIYYRARIWVEKSKIVPVFKEEYAKVFLREMHETLSSDPSIELKIDQETYKYLLEQLGFKKEMKPMVLQAIDNENTSEVTQGLVQWEMLYELSSVMMLRLYQGEKFKTLHDKHFERVKNEWKSISEIKKMFVENKLSTKELKDKILHNY